MASIEINRLVTRSLEPIHEYCYFPAENVVHCERHMCVEWNGVLKLRRWIERVGEVLRQRVRCRSRIVLGILRDRGMWITWRRTRIGLSSERPCGTIHIVGAVSTIQRFYMPVIRCAVCQAAHTIRDPGSIRIPIDH